MAKKSGLTMQWGGLDKIVGNIADNLKNTQELTSAIGEHLVSAGKSRITDGIDVDGQPFISSKRAQRDGGKTLIDTANLRKSLTYAGTRTNVLVGSNLPYARIHNLGGTPRLQGNKNMPKRQYIGINEEDIREIRSMITDFLLGK